MPDQIHERLALEPKTWLARESFSDPFDHTAVFIHEEEEPRHGGTHDVDGSPRAGFELLRSHADIRRERFGLPEKG